MRTDICARDDTATQAALLDALAAAGAHPDADSPPDVPFPTGLTRFQAGRGTLTVFADAWLVDLEGPDELVREVVQYLAARDSG